MKRSRWKFKHCKRCGLQHIELGRNCNKCALLLAQRRERIEARKAGLRKVGQEEQL